MDPVERSEKKGKISGKNIGVIAVILTALTLITAYCTHRRIPFMMDDEWYSTLLCSDEPIRNLSDIVKAMQWHYNNWGGRIMTHGLLQMILLSGELVADILNTLAMLILSYLIVAVADVPRKSRPLALFIALASITGLNANWKMSMFWEAGAANYLYITIFILLFILPYLYILRGKKISIPAPVLCILMIPLGFICGCSNENMGPAMWILSLCVIIGYFKGSGQFEGSKPAVSDLVWMIIGNAFCLIGSIVCIVAPGNFARSAEAPDASLGMLWKIFLRSYYECRAFFEYLIPSILVFIIFAVCCRKTTWKYGKDVLLFLACALLSFGAMFLSPHYPDRATFGTMIMIICAALSLFGKYASDDEFEKDLFSRRIILVTSMIIWLRGMYFMCEYLANFKGWIR